jgi:hypothetical protein
MSWAKQNVSDKIFTIKAFPDSPLTTSHPPPPLTRKYRRGLDPSLPQPKRTKFENDRGVGRHVGEEEKKNTSFSGNRENPNGIDAYRDGLLQMLLLPVSFQSGTCPQV